MKRIHLAFSFVAVLTGCAGLIGVPDLEIDEGGGGQLDGAASDGSVDPSKDGSAPGTDGGDASTTCDPSQLATDAKNCGRCGHDCLGGACNAGKCASVLVQGGLSNPDDLVVDSANVYVTARGNGTVLRIPKDGSAASVLATGQTEARGVTLDDTKTRLYWSNLDFPGDGVGEEYVGGVWGCTLPACADKGSVTTGDWASNVRFFGGKLYFAENNNSSVVSVAQNGTGRTALVDNATKPFSLAVDGQFVYYEAFSGVERVPVAGGATEEIDGIYSDADTLGFITVDNDRVYYAYIAEGGGGHVRSVLKASPASPKVEYGTTNKGSLGITVDDENVYWTNAGTFQTTDPYANNNDGEIRSCPKAGCSGEPTMIESGLLNPGAIATDGDAIYYLVFGTQYGSSNGELRRIAKP